MMNKEEESFYKKYKNLVDRPYQTRFLSLNEQNIMKMIDPNVNFFGGYQNAERKRGTNNLEYNIALLKVDYQKKYYNVSHRDVLGDLYNLGINMDLVGDIVIDNENIYFFVSKEQIVFFKENLTKIKNANVKLIEVDYDSIDFIDKGIQKKEFVKSMRLDLIVSNIFHISRKDTKELILNEDIRVNSKIITNPAKVLESSQIISVRGHGRIKIEKVNSYTKRGNINLDILVYK